MWIFSLSRVKPLFSLWFGPGLAVVVLVLDAFSGILVFRPPEKLRCDYSGSKLARWALLISTVDAAPILSENLPFSRDFGLLRQKNH